MAVNFSPSQISYRNRTSPLTFRISPFTLLWSDVKLLPQLIATLFNTILPLRTKNSRAELNLQVRGNVISIILQIVVGLISLGGLLGVLIVIFIPISVLGFALYCAIIAALCAPGTD